ncbi:AMMECR1 domain-containing protein [Candidatus Gracilibacteria bacterium]|nr:AMMECR1 domain-containing protein [Candidatus Gracilibacteria bacterium]
MISIAKQVIEYFAKTGKKISIIDLKIDDKTMINEKINCFVTVYLKGEVRGSAGNIKELKDNAIEEIIENTFAAISKDARFQPVSPAEANELKIRIDKISDRTLLKDKSIKTLDPTKVGVIAIKNSYEKMACILPNINPKLLSGEDFINVLKEKLQEPKFNENEYIIYEIKTEVFTSY